MSDAKKYIGDGVYVDHDYCTLILTTEDEIETTNTIYLDPDVMGELMRYYQRIIAERTE